MQSTNIQNTIRYELVSLNRFSATKTPIFGPTKTLNFFTPTQLTFWNFFRAEKIFFTIFLPEREELRAIDFFMLLRGAFQKFYLHYESKIILGNTQFYVLKITISNTFFLSYTSHIFLYSINDQPMRRYFIVRYLLERKMLG